jgi:hypothetical protein
MHRHYEDAGKPEQGRKWNCFVCNKLFDTYEGYKGHIIEKHEQGREYIKCPSCDAPVRDMRAHFAAKHPNRLLPKNVQMRVGIWNDFGPTGKKKTRKPHFISGEYDSLKNGATLHYRSGLERDFYEQLEADLDVLGFVAEPFKIPYFYNGEWHNYLPDLRVDFIDGSTEIWEIKPENQMKYEQNECKWASMKNHAESMGWEFIIFNEAGLDKLKNKVSKQRRLNEGRAS